MASCCQRQGVQGKRIRDCQSVSKMRFVADQHINRQNLIKKVNEAVDSDKVYEITITEMLKEYNDEQRGALWGVAYKILSDETGNDAEDLHLYFCGEYFGWKTAKVMGQSRKTPIRTTTRDHHGKRDVISTADLAAMYNFIQQRSSQTVGVYIPDPDPDWKKRMAA